LSGSPVVPTRRGRRRLGGALVIAGLAGSLAAGMAANPSVADAATDDDIVVVGKVFRATNTGAGNVPMLGDPINHMGFGFEGEKGGRLYDLTGPELLATNRCNSVEGCTPPWSSESASMVSADTKRQLLFVPRDLGSSNNTTPMVTPCTSESAHVRVWDYGPGPGGRRQPLEESFWSMPCARGQQFGPTAMTYHRPTDSLTIVGARGLDAARHIGFGSIDDLLAYNKGEELLVRSVRPDPGGKRFMLDWEVDLRSAGCGRLDQPVTKVAPFVARRGNDIFALCHDADAALGFGGDQAYLVRIPLTVDPSDGIARPTLAHTSDFLPPDQTFGYLFYRSPLLAGTLLPKLDPVTGNLLLVTSSAANGRAVWVYEPYAQRFLGVVTGGYANEAAGTLAVGFDEVRGRVYLLTQAGLLLVSVRHTPLPGGELYPVLAGANVNPERAKVAPITVFPTAGRNGAARLVVYAPRGSGDEDSFWVLEDRTPSPVKPKAPDPDRLTSTAEEIAGRPTEVSAGGRGLASGARLLVTGGVARTIAQRDPACVVPPLGDQVTFPFPSVEEEAFGTCLGPAVLTPGHREALLAATDAEAGTSAGVVGRAAAQAFGPNDLATDGDLKRVGGCHLGLFQMLTFNGAEPEDYAQYAAGCEQFWDNVTGRTTDETGERRETSDPQDPRRRLPDPRDGTIGRQGQGFPVARFECTDFGATPNTRRQAPFPEAPEGALSSAAVQCDQRKLEGTAGAAFSALALPDPDTSEVSVARAWSSVSSHREGRFHVTMATARAEGIRVGPLSITSATSVVTTRAGGLATTAATEYRRLLCGIRFEDVPGAEDVPGCVDPDDEETAALFYDINQALARIHLRVTAVERRTTRGGYEAVVTKHSAERGADQTVNDDDSPMVSALDVVVYTDGVQGRNRYILQLASVHAEARYGINPLPEGFDGGGFTPGPDDDEAPPEGESSPGPTSTGSSPSGDEFYEEELESLDDLERTASRPLPFLGRTRNPVGRALRGPLGLLRDVIGLLVTNPREFALLFVTWSLLATPVYLGIRRRGFTQVVEA